MNRTIEEARNYLKDDLEDYPYVLSNPLGHSGTKRKILSYIFACLLGGETKPNCVDWLYQLYAKQTDNEKHNFQLVIDSIADAVYSFKEYLDNNQVR